MSVHYRDMRTMTMWRKIDGEMVPVEPWPWHICGDPKEALKHAIFFGPYQDRKQDKEAKE